MAWTTPTVVGSGGTSGNTQSSTLQTSASCSFVNGKSYLCWVASCDPDFTAHTHNTPTGGLTWSPVRSVIPGGSSGDSRMSLYVAHCTGDTSAVVQATTSTSVLGRIRVEQWDAFEIRNHDADASSWMDASGSITLPALASADSAMVSGWMGLVTDAAITHRTNWTELSEQTFNDWSEAAQGRLETQYRLDTTDNVATATVSSCWFMPGIAVELIHAEEEEEDVTITGAASFDLAASGNVQLSSPVTGAASFDLAASGAVQVTSPITGAASFDLSASGALLVISPITGAASFDLAASGAAQVDSPITGAGSFDLDATGELSFGIAITGAASFDLAASGNVQLSSPVAGAASFDLAASGALLVISPITGAGSFDLSASGLLGLEGVEPPAPPTPPPPVQAQSAIERGTHVPYKTRQGDRWDAISKRCYGTPYLYELIIAANPTVPIRPVLDEGIVLAIPLLEQPGTAEPAGIPPELLPPWKRPR